MSAKPFRHSDRGESLSSCEKFGAGRWGWVLVELATTWRPPPWRLKRSPRNHFHFRPPHFTSEYLIFAICSKTPSDQQIDAVASLFRHNEFSLI